jgi:ligand-binding SRPBCC domain-containing protein
MLRGWKASSMTENGSVDLTTNSDGSAELTARQRISLPIADVFDFFADATNLEAITPASLRFQIITPSPIEMRTGTTIDYRLRIHGVPTRWRSRISVWEPPHRFADTQLRGPYRFWHHEHTFAEDGHGTVMCDHVHYRAPGGRLVNRLLVARDIEKIFRYRQACLVELLGSADGERRPTGR